MSNVLFNDLSIMSPYSIDNYIGQEVRRINLVLKRAGDGQYYHLFSIVELLEQDMSDYSSYQPDENKRVFMRCDNKASGKADKVFLFIDRCRLEKDFLNKPWENHIVESDHLIAFNTDYAWRNNMESVIVPLHEEDRQSELISILPNRKTSAFVKVCGSIGAKEAIRTIMCNTAIKNQIDEITTKVLGYDFSKHSQFYGSYVFVSYNPIFRSVELTENPSKPGFFCRLNFRVGMQSGLQIEVVSKDRDGLRNEYVSHNIEKGRFLSLINLNKQFHSLDINFLDNEGNLLDYYENVTFIHQIKFEMNIKTSEVHAKDEDGNETVFDKFVSENSTLGKADSIGCTFGSSPDFEYEKFEKSLDFVFFDGDKDYKAQNEDRAKECISRIINSASTRCYISDIFFTNSTLNKFILPCKRIDVEIRVLSSNEKLKPKEKGALKKKIEEYRTKKVANVYCRLFKGKAELHDRFIVADDKVWMLGCSLNEFGQRATTLIRVPNTYASKILARVEEWWNNDKLTSSL